jgi:hypothetical protein
MMCIADGLAIIALDIVEPTERDELESSLQASELEIVRLSRDQVISFAGNMLGLRNQKGEPLLVMSGTAFECLTMTQRLDIERHARIIQADVATIERVGGGSVRCMMAENFLQKI